VLIVDHYQIQKVGCFKQGLVHNVEDSFVGFHHEEAAIEFEEV
jgi:hypothetical protein